MMKKINDILSAPCEVAIEVTGKCNLNCKYCFNEITNYDIPISKLKDILDQTDKMNVFEVCITGGEPFIREDIFEILDYASRKNYVLLIVTNGTLLTPNNIKILDEMGLINSIQISLDSSDENTHNSVRGLFTETMLALKEIKKVSSSLPTIGIVIHRQNYGNICNSLQSLSEYCSGFHLMNIQVSNEALKHKNDLFLNSSTLSETWKEIERFSRRNSIKVDIDDYDLKKIETARFTGCTAGKTKVAITPELNVIPCDMARSLIIGNLNEMTLEQIWNSDKANEIRNLDIEPCYNLNKEWYLEKSQIIK